MSLAAKLPFRHRHAAGFPGLGSQPVPTDADALDYLDRMAAADGASVEVGVATAVDAFIADSKALGVWDSIRSSCILAGARTLAGALVPLRDYGPELWDTASPGSAVISDNGSGVATTWDAATLTFTCDDTYTTSYPRIAIPISGIEAGKQYRLSGRFSGDSASILWIAVDNTGSSTVSVNASTGEFNGTSTAAGVVPYVTISINGSTGPLSITIESISIREVIAAPTNVANGFVNGDFSRTSGLTGDGTSYLDSGRANDADPQNDWHLGLYYSTVNPAAGKIDAGAGGSALGSLNFAQAASDLFVRSKSTSPSESVGTTGTGFAGLSRSLSTAYDYRVNASTGSASTTSRTPTTDNVFIFARNDGAGNGAFPTDATFAFYSIGTSLSLEDLDTSVSNLINRLKFALLVGENPSGLDPDTIDYIVRGYEAGGSLE